MAKTKKIGYRIREDLYEKLQNEKNATQLIETLLDYYYESDVNDLQKKIEQTARYIIAEEKIKYNIKDSK